MSYSSRAQTRTEAAPRLRAADVLVHEVIHRPSIAWLTQGRSGARLAAHLAASHTDVEAVGEIAAAAGWACWSCRIWCPATTWSPRRSGCGWRRWGMPVLWWSART